MIKKVIKFLLESIETITVSLSIFVMIYLFLGRPMEVLGYSMEPNLEHQERLIIENLSLRFGNLERGQIVVLHPPTDPDIDYVKRVISIPGDTLTVKDCKIFIKNQEYPLGLFLEESYLPADSCTRGGQSISENTPVFIPDGYYMVLGDNREHSLDSRTFGLVPKSAIVGRAWIRFWPPEKWKVF